MSRILLLPLVLIACKTTGGVDPAKAEPAVSEWIPFDKSEGSIKVKVTVNGRPAVALLDSGASGASIDATFAKKLGIAIGRRGFYVTGAAGEKRLDAAEEFNVSFVGSKNAGDGVSVQDAVILDRPFGVDVMLGLQLFRELVLQIDYPNARFRYMTPSASTIVEQANTKIMEEEYSGRVLMEIEANGKSQWVLMDTGNQGALYLNRRAAQDGGWLRTAKPAGRQVTISTITRDADTELMVLDRVKIGPFELEDVPLVVETQIDARKSAPPVKLGSHIVSDHPTKPGILGYDLLKHFVVTIDLTRQLLHLYAP